MENKNLYEGYKAGSIRVGRITLIIAIITSFFPGIYVSLAEGAWPGFEMIFQAFIPIAIAMLITWIVEPVAYFPVLGITGTYVSWLTGNVMNLRIPCSIMSQQVAGVEEGTPEGDAFSTIGLCVSVFVNLAIVLLFAVVGAQILGVMPESLQEGFNYLLPAVIGSTLVMFIKRCWYAVAVACVIALICNLAGVSTVDMPIIVFATIVVSLVMYRKGIVK